VNDPRFLDRFLPPVPGSDPEARAWARAEADRLPAAILACLDSFTVRDRIAGYEGDYRRHPERGALANLLLLPAALDQTIAWRSDLLPTRPAPQRDQEGGVER
jgi:hypothetical protein